MRYSPLIISLLPLILFAAKPATHRLDELTVTARRPLKELGMVKSTIDSAALHENISLSIADVIAFNSSIYIKNYGRGTESTVAFRGTSPSHTKVTWNGMQINSPMLGMTDFSTIPSFLVDQAVIYHGSSGINTTGGGLGGLVSLSTRPVHQTGLELQYIQGVGSYKTFDEAAGLRWGNRHWQLSTRFVASRSANDFKFVNYDKKENICDSNNQIVSTFHPVEHNRNGAFNDLHFLQEAYYHNNGNRAGLAVWWMRANRELPLLTTDYGEASSTENRRREETVRGIASWDHYHSKWNTALKGGITHTWMAYDYARERTPGQMVPMSTARSHVTTLFGHIDGQYNPVDNLFLTAELSLHQHFVDSHDRNVTAADGSIVALGYKEARAQIGASLSAKWQINKTLGISGILRYEIMGTKKSPLIPALFFDAMLLESCNLMLKGSVSQNYRFPSLNDLYFMPGGNPDLKSESGLTYDIAVTWAKKLGAKTVWNGSAGWFDSYIDNWIIWLPTAKGYFTPLNVKDVRAYGVEFATDLTTQLFNDWLLNLNGSFSWTPSINRGDQMTEADLSVGRQLPYVPRLSAAVTCHITHKRWGFLYKWNFYSRRYTMSSNDASITGSLPPYFMNNIALDYTLPLKAVDLQFKIAVNNLFNEKYLSVLSRPMPGINWEFYIAVKFRNNK